MSESHIDKLTQYLAKFPGLGPRSARRAVLYLLTQGKDIMLPLAEEIKSLSESIQTCKNCRNLDTASPCAICTDEKRDRSMVCVVEDVADLWAFERNQIYNGLYHVLGGTLSAIDSIGPQELGIEKLLNRIKELDIQEVIMATNATVEGQTTLHYITGLLANTGAKITTLARGIPVGGELDYMDEGTLVTALNSRRAV